MAQQYLAQLPEHHGLSRSGRPRLKSFLEQNWSGSFTAGLGFGLKLQKIEALLRMGSIPCASDIKPFIGQCRLAGEGCNNALHARHLMSTAGRWQRLKKDKVTEVSATELRRLCDLVVKLYSAAITFGSIKKAKRTANAHPG